MIGAILLTFCGLVGGITIPFYAQTGRFMWQWLGLAAAVLGAVSGLNASISFSTAMLLYIPSMYLGIIISDRIFKRSTQC